MAAGLTAGVPGIKKPPRRTGAVGLEQVGLYFPAAQQDEAANTRRGESGND